MLESKSTANVSPSLSFELENGSTFTFNFQHDGQVMIISFQDGKAVSGPLTSEQAAELRDVLNAFLEKRK